MQSKQIGIISGIAVIIAVASVQEELLEMGMRKDPIALSLLVLFEIGNIYSDIEK